MPLCYGKLQGCCVSIRSQQQQVVDQNQRPYLRANTDVPHHPKSSARCPPTVPASIMFWTKPAESSPSGLTLFVANSPHTSGHKQGRPQPQAVVETKVWSTVPVIHDVAELLAVRASVAGGHKSIDLGNARIIATVLLHPVLLVPTGVGSPGDDAHSCFLGWRLVDESGGERKDKG